MKHISSFDGTEGYYYSPNTHRGEWMKTSAISMSDGIIRRILNIFGDDWDKIKKNDSIHKWTTYGEVGLKFKNLISEKGNLYINKQGINRIVVFFDTKANNILYCKIRRFNYVNDHTISIVDQYDRFGGKYDSLQEIVIEEAEDYWFNVAFSYQEKTEFYNCDDFDGLIKLLKNKRVI